MNGIIVLNKPKDSSSAWYAYLMRPILGIRRIGHAGALDPAAEGVLIACVDRACKCTEMLMGLPKLYQVTVQLGVTNACHDTEQPVEPYPNAQPPSGSQAVRLRGISKEHLEERIIPVPQVQKILVGYRMSHEDSIPKSA